MVCNKSYCDCNGVDDVNAVNVSLRDRKIKEFISLCSELEDCVSVMTRDGGHIRVNEEYFGFRRTVSEFKEKAILEAYKNDSFEWKF